MQCVILDFVIAYCFMSVPTANYTLNSIQVHYAFTIIVIKHKIDKLYLDKVLL